MYKKIHRYHLLEPFNVSLWYDIHERFEYFTADWQMLLRSSLQALGIAKIDKEYREMNTVHRRQPSYKTHLMPLYHKLRLKSFDCKVARVDLIFHWRTAKQMFQEFWVLLLNRFSIFATLRDKNNNYWRFKIGDSAGAKRNIYTNVVFFVVRTKFNYHIILILLDTRVFIASFLLLRKRRRLWFHKYEST